MTVWYAGWNEDEDSIFFRDLGGYDKTAWRHSVDLAVVYVLYCIELNFEVQCGKYESLNVEQWAVSRGTVDYLMWYQIA
jgi:hypothetical protein